MDETEKRVLDTHELLKKSGVSEAIDIVYEALISQGYTEINDIEDRFPEFELKENAKLLEFQIFYAIAIKTLTHVMKNYELTAQAAIGDLVIADLAKIMGLPIPTEENTAKAIQKLTQDIESQ